MNKATENIYKYQEEIARRSTIKLAVVSAILIIMLLAAAVEFVRAGETGAQGKGNRSVWAGQLFDGSVLPHKKRV